jgi:hypothetical protein
LKNFSLNFIRLSFAYSCGLTGTSAAIVVALKQAFGERALAPFPVLDAVKVKVYSSFFSQFSTTIQFSNIAVFPFCSTCRSLLPA